MAQALGQALTISPTLALVVMVISKAGTQLGTYSLDPAGASRDHKTPLNLTPHRVVMALGPALKSNRARTARDLEQELQTQPILD